MSDIRMKVDGEWIEVDPSSLSINVETNEHKVIGSLGPKKYYKTYTFSIGFELDEESDE